MDILTVGDINEDVSTKDIQDFVFEMGSHEIFSEVHEVDEINRDGAFEHGTKWTEHVLWSEGKIIIAEGIELIKCNEILDSDNRGHLIDLNLETCFEEKFDNEQ